MIKAPWWGCRPEMRTALAMLAVALLLSPPAAATPALDDCEASVRADPEGHSGGCFLRLARQAGLQTSAAERLADLTDRYPDNLRLRFTLGRLWLELGRYRQAETAFAELAGEFEQRRELRWTYWCRDNRFRALAYSGRYPEAEEELVRTLAVAAALEEPEILLEVEVQEVAFQAQTGRDLAGAWLRSRSLETSVQASGNARLQRDFLMAQGALAHSLGNLDGADAAYRSLLDLALSLGDLGLEATAHLNLATVTTARPPRSEVRLQLRSRAYQALASAEAAGAVRLEARARILIAKLEGGKAARDHLEICLGLTAELEIPALESACARALAVTLLEEDPPRARRLIERSRHLDHRADDPLAAAHGWPERLRVSWAVESLDRAVEDSLAELDLIESLRHRQPSGEGRAAVFGPWIEVYRWVFGRILLAADEEAEPEGLLDLAFQVQERMRARVLLEALAAAEIFDPESALPVVDPATLPTRSEIRGTLKDDEALFSFHAGSWEDIYGHFAGGAWLQVHTRDGTRSYRLPDRRDLELQLPVFQHLFERRDGAEAVPATGLYDRLLRTAAEDLPPELDRWILLLDGTLHLLPFAALRPEPQGLPLATTRRLSRVPSAALWYRWRHSRPSSVGDRALVVADPALPEPSIRTAVERRSWSSMAPPGPLPFARDEAKTVLRTWGHGARSLVGDGAREDLLTFEAQDNLALLHLAAHAVVDHRAPRNSAILLAPGGDHDGLLQPQEITRLNVRDSLVVLSACSSASGPNLEGEGLLSLARAFFQAEARTVIGSLWPLRDEDAAAFFRDFYRHFGRGATAAEALAQAQAEALAEERPADAWAALVLLGDGELRRAVPMPGPRRRWGLLLGVLGAAALALVGLGAGRLSRRSRS